MPFFRPKWCDTKSPRLLKSALTQAWLAAMSHSACRDGACADLLSQRLWGTTDRKPPCRVSSIIHGTQIQAVFKTCNFIPFYCSLHNGIHSWSPSTMILPSHHPHVSTSGECTMLKFFFAFCRCSELMQMKWPCTLWVQWVFLCLTLWPKTIQKGAHVFRIFFWGGGIFSFLVVGHGSLLFATFGDLNLSFCMLFAPFGDFNLSFCMLFAHFWTSGLHFACYLHTFGTSTCPFACFLQHFKHLNGLFTVCLGLI